MNNVIEDNGFKNSNQQVDIDSKSDAKKEIISIPIFDENEEYLKIYELFNMPYFMRVMQKIDPRDYRLLFLKLNYPDKSISEISAFTGIGEEKIKEAFKNGIVELKKVMNSLINDAFGITDDIDVPIYKMDKKDSM